MSLKILNYKSLDTVHIPVVILHGVSSEESGIIQAYYNGNFFPQQYFDVNAKYFKALIYLQPGPNLIYLTYYPGYFRNSLPIFDSQSRLHVKPFSETITINYTPLLNNPPLHLCLLVGKDSPMTFDSPEWKKKLEGNDLNLAVRKLKLGGRLMQAFTNEQMLRNNLGNRCFRFEEEYSNDTLSKVENKNNKNDPTFTYNNLRSNIKVYILKSEKTVSQLRDPHLAQQNNNGKNKGGLFGIACDALKKYGAPFDKPSQCAVMFLDTHWDSDKNLILAHAALGGSIDRYKLAIFGSHGLWSWPSSFEELHLSFSECIKTNTKEVANDCNECGSAWECLNVTLGAFLHEIGHLLGCPHQPSGVMLRDYVTFNRSFMTIEQYSTRTKSNGLFPILPKDECDWHRLDLLRFLYHPSFKLPNDWIDNSVPNYPDIYPQKTVLYPLNDGNIVCKSSTGIYLVELHTDDKCRAHLEYLPKNLKNGVGPQNEILLNYYGLENLLPQDQKGKKLSLEILSIGSQYKIDDFLKLSNESSKSRITGHFGLNRGNLVAFKSSYLGSKDNQERPFITFNPREVICVRVYHGGALDGVEFMTRYGSNFVGNKTKNYTDFPLNKNESISSFKLKCGSWVDAIQIITSTGRQSEMLGNKNGGGLGELSPPEGFEIIGLSARVSSWIDGLACIYVNE
ncbi:putative metalloendopeptidase ASCRUDRAFT_40751 [Ascoidea rubescens DSM 1968]|uniref:Jacalin-type lectin domain-containing protein n=1 Tax=Ascoidea rubescens DSM 1968 TaxID=1344418 RepID=A0A1D2VPB5_9ASCO|nr:hypothetical protein ASCRUDRAFT_40751 [Ascoidea rubescens DSM 1968]ODV63453.1 hypothetical protein ASCRUDRAFT_40751 [Ascoidea rubescens DSM 1968]